MTSKFLFVEGNQFLQLSALRFMMSPNYLLASEAAKGNVCRMLRQTQKDFAAFSKLYCQHTHTTTLGLKNQAKSPETASKQGRKKSNKYGKRRRSSSKNQMLDQPLVIVVLGILVGSGSELFTIFSFRFVNFSSISHAYIPDLFKGHNISHSVTSIIKQQGQYILHMR